jgi:hypothetical protein
MIVMMMAKTPSEKASRRLELVISRVFGPAIRLSPRADHCCGGGESRGWRGLRYADGGTRQPRRD